MSEEELIKYPKKPICAKDIHHRSFEKVINSINRDVYEYNTILTKKTRDNGVDIYLFDIDGDFAAVEIKQKQNLNKPVGIEALQKLTGAAYNKNLKQMHFVTNGRISKACYGEAELARNQNMRVTLRDFRDFAVTMDLIQVISGKEIDPNFPYAAWRKNIWDITSIQSPYPENWWRL